MLSDRAHTHPRVQVTHAVVSYPFRHVLLRMPERAALLQRLLTARIELFLRGKRGGRQPGPAQAAQRAALATKVDAAAERLRAHDADSQASVCLCLPVASPVPRPCLYSTCAACAASHVLALAHVRARAYAHRHTAPAGSRRLAFGRP